jgi:hypothetical protein
MGSWSLRLRNLMIKRAPQVGQGTFAFVDADPALEGRDEISKIVAKERGFLWRLLNNAAIKGGRMGLSQQEVESCRVLLRNMGDMPDDQLINAVEALKISVKLHPFLIRFERIALIQMHRAYNLLHGIH